MLTAKAAVAFLNSFSQIAQRAAEVVSRLGMEAGGVVLVGGFERGSSPSEGTGQL